MARLLSYDHILTRLTEVLQATTRERLLDLFAHVVDDAGGTGFGIALLPAAAQLQVSYSEGLNGYVEHYLAAGYSAYCPVTRRISNSSLAFCWSDVRVAEDDRMAQVVMNTAREFGISGGLVVPMHLREGQKGGVFVLMPETELIDPVRQWLSMLSMALHSRLMQLGMELQQSDEPLSIREREVLRWMAEGKSAEDVADILGISAATVMFHYRNVAVRYGTLNRTHTVVEAIRRGALGFG